MRTYHKKDVSRHARILSYRWTNTATDCTGTNQAKLRQENSDFTGGIYERFVTDKGISVVATDGVGTKDLNRYVVDIAYYIYSFGRFWWQNEPKMKVFG